MKRLAAVVVVAGISLSAVLLPSSPALAKGPTGLRIEGPGLTRPYERSIVTEGETAAADQAKAFVEAAQMWSLGAHYLCRLPSAPRGDLGEKYVLTWAPRVVTKRYDVDKVTAAVPMDFYPAALGGAVTDVPAIRGVASGGWFRADGNVRTNWDAVLADVGKSGGSGVAREGRDLTIRGPGLSRSIGIVDPTSDTDPYLSFADQSGLGMELWSGAGTCRESAAPTQALGPKFTVTWTVGDPANPESETQIWGVQDVYLDAAGGPVIFDHAGSMINGDSGWFRPGSALPGAWQKLGLQTGSDRTAARPVRSTPAPGVDVAAAAARSGSSSYVWAWFVLGAVLVAIALAITYARRRRSSARP